jgi:hypothetical protein
MAWIDVIDEEDADGSLARLYTALVEPDSGRVDNILKIHSLDPAVLKGHLALYRASMTGGGGLTPPHCEMIAWTVSRANDCFY